MEHIFRLADAIHLHDQLLVITADPFTHGTDSGWTLGDDPEYPLSVPQDMAQMILERVWQSGRAPRLPGTLGAGRHYQEYPVEEDLAELAVATYGDRMLEIKMILQAKNGIRWREQWTYCGAYTITWPAEDAPEAESQG